MHKPKRNELYGLMLPLLALLIVLSGSGASFAQFSDSYKQQHGYTFQNGQHWDLTAAHQLPLNRTTGIAGEWSGNGNVPSMGQNGEDPPGLTGPPYTCAGICPELSAGMAWLTGRGFPRSLPGPGGELMVYYSPYPQFSIGVGSLYYLSTMTEDTDNFAISGDRSIWNFLLDIRGDFDPEWSWAPDAGVYLVARGGYLLGGQNQLQESRFPPEDDPEDPGTGLDDISTKIPPVMLQMNGGVEEENGEDEETEVSFYGDGVIAGLSFGVVHPVSENMGVNLGMRINVSQHFEWEETNVPEGEPDALFLRPRTGAFIGIKLGLRLL